MSGRGYIVPADDGTSNTAFIDYLRDEDYPWLLEYVDRKGNVVWSDVITGPGAFRVPALGKIYGRVEPRITFPDGQVWSGSDPAPTIR